MSVVTNREIGKIGNSETVGLVGLLSCGRKGRMYFCMEGRMDFCMKGRMDSALPTPQWEGVSTPSRYSAPEERHRP